MIKRTFYGWYIIDYCERWDLKQTMSPDFLPFQQVRDPSSSKISSFFDAFGLNEK
jgi:hypothetical protein